MTQRVIGLDIGSHAVRAAELRLGRDGSVALNRFGQVALPVGAVRGGEVVQPAQVAESLRRLWKEVGFASRRVIVGVGNQRVIVRPMEFPAMGEEELKSAVELQAVELIPMPRDEVVLDHQVLERFVSDDGTDMIRVLIVAAQREMVGNLLSAVELAGLTPTLVDLIPFALLRSLADVTGFDDLESGERTGEAIVSVGSGVTTIVVHERGIPRFVRMLMRGGSSFTDRLSSDLSVDLGAAEGLKRQVSMGGFEAHMDQAATSLDSAVISFAEEIQASLQFHTVQPGSAPLSRLVLAGGGSRVAGLAGHLSTAMGVPVEAGAPFAHLQLGRTGLSDAQLREAEDLVAVAVGLGLAGRPVDRGARRLTLLPSDFNQRHRNRQQGGLVACGLGLVIAVMMFVWVQKRNEIVAVQDETASLELEAAATQSRISSLSHLQGVEVEFSLRTGLVGVALANDVAWSKLIQEVATVLPDDVWFDSFSGLAPQNGEVGRFTVTAKGADHTSSARWMMRLGNLESVQGLWVPSSIVRENQFGQEEVQFSSTGVLTLGALSGRLGAYVAQILPGAPEPPLSPDGVVVDSEYAEGGLPWELLEVEATAVVEGANP